MSSSKIPPVTNSPQDNQYRIVFENCYLQDDVEQYAESYPEVNVCTFSGVPHSPQGCVEPAIFSIPSGEYPKGTLFDVIITFTAKRPVAKAGI
jgi:hypothetical protein